MKLRLSIARSRVASSSVSSWMGDTRGAAFVTSWWNVMSVLATRLISIVPTWEDIGIRLANIISRSIAIKTNTFWLKACKLTMLFLYNFFSFSWQNFLKNWFLWNLFSDIMMNFPSTSWILFKKIKILSFLVICS
jgi:hypothetical protein